MAQVIVRQYTPDPLIHALVSNFRRRPVIREACSFADELAIEIAEAFHKWKANQRIGVPHRELVRQFYADECKVFTCNEGNDRQGGFAILHGKLIGLHNVKPGCGDWMMRRALEEGARSLQCWGTPKLLMFYSKHGFSSVKVEPHHTNPSHPMLYTMELSK